MENKLAKLHLDKNIVKKGREYANRIALIVQDFIEEHTTTTIERSTIRLLGVNGVNKNDVPLPNVVVDNIKGELGSGILFPFVNGMCFYDVNAQKLAEMISKKRVNLKEVPNMEKEKVISETNKLVKNACLLIKKKKDERTELIRKLGDPPKPWLYVIVATGNIYEDVKQAKAAVREGADVIAVIRSTAQSLLDYVPYGITTTGYGGTYATQANFKIMREALDEVAEEVGRYIRQVNYCSGLAMPEIAVMGAFERLDMMLNDCLYGIIFRGINLKRTFIDQYFSRMINAATGVIINTGEDNYLTTADAYEAAHTVITSQFINEQFALFSGLKPEQIGLGHAFQINPHIEDSLIYEIAQAQLVRELFPDYPLKYMPPTVYKTGDIFFSNLLDGMFNFVGILTNQHIQLLGMPTEAIHTPFLQDRFISIKNAKYIFNSSKNLGVQISFNKDSKIIKRANQVLKDAINLLEEIADVGLFKAIEKGVFADIKRKTDSGRGLEGVIKKKDDYYNPFFQELKKV